MNFIFPDRLIFGQHKHKQTNGPIKMNPNDDDDHHNSHENEGAREREKNIIEQINRVIIMII